jgi:hypothetical protein
MSENFENHKNEVALRRFAAVSFIEQKVREGLGVIQALRLAALRPWPDENGRYSSARTLEDYWYAWKSGGFAALQPKSRDDEGTFRKMPDEVGQWLLSQVSQYPEIPLKVLYERWTKAGQQLPSLRTHRLKRNATKFLPILFSPCGAVPSGRVRMNDPDQAFVRETRRKEFLARLGDPL